MRGGDEQAVGLPRREQRVQVPDALLEGQGRARCVHEDPAEPLMDARDHQRVVVLVEALLVAEARRGAQAAVQLIDPRVVRALDGAQVA